MSLHRRRPRRDSLVVLPDEEAAVENAIDVLLDGARHSVNLTLPGSAEQSKVGAPALLRLRAAGRERRVVRLLCGTRGLNVDLIRTVEKRSPRLGMRVTKSALQEVLITDGRFALVRATLEAEGDCVMIVQDPAVVRTLDLLFAGVWEGAMPPAEYTRLSRRLSSDVARCILERLRDGTTDAVGAREIQVSLRTYRRHVADIMRELDANSRFQAGVRAVELGLLSPEG
ncbi:DNA-binding response regulator [Streptomyces sp. BG9H]|uniref:DNA-binding response regulator n=1 Tax=Streptomyces anatolicus TaxID=2675858 RepID=A0ABS6YJ96_9ACTN|nr:DNA-binding response regulator [Streptomyces anatolicus]MBW5420657.1 DNA-binding response regulator [Streptomyces anatolicus]